MAGSSAPTVQKQQGESRVKLAQLDLNACYQLALARSEQVGFRWEEIRAAQARYWQAVSGILPNVSIVSNQSWQNKNANIGAGGVGLSGKRFQSALEVTQPLFSGFREFYGMAGARAEKEATIADWRRQRQVIYSDVAMLFYQILMYEQQLKITGEIESVLNTQGGEISRRVKLGRSRPSEGLAASADLADAAALNAQTRGLLGVSRELLAFWTGIPVERLHIVDGTKLPKPGALALYLQGALLRPDVIAGQQRQTVAQRRLSVARADYWPTVTAAGDYYLETGPGDRREWDLSIRIDVPIFDGGLTQAREGEAKARVRQATLLLSEVERTAKQETRVAYVKFTAAARELVELNSLAEAAKRNADAQRGDYQKGAASYLGVLDAQRLALDARRREAQATANAYIALAELAVAAGETPETGGPGA